MTQTHKEEMKKSIFSIIAMVFISFVFMHDQLDVYAADAAISFKESQYIVDEGDEIEIQVNINADGNIGYYEVKLRYDNTRMTYVSGAEEEKDGILTLKGTGWGKEVDYEHLKFKAVSGGNAGIAVQEAHIYSNDGDMASYSVSAKPTAAVSINGDDHGENSFFDQLLEEESVNETQNTYGIKTDKPVVGCINKDGENYYILDITDYEPQISLWNYTPVTGSYMKKNITYISDKDCNVNVLLIMDADGNQSMIAYNTETSQYYAVHELQEQDSTYYVMSVLACKDIPNQMTEEEISSNTVCYAIGKDGSGGYYRYTKNGKLENWENGNTKSESAGISRRTVLNIIWIILILLLIIDIYLYKKNKYGSYSIKQYWFVIRELTGREIKRKYARSFLGIAWSVLNPLLYMAVMSLIFSSIFKASIEKFPTYFLTAYIIWQMFSTSTSTAMTVLPDNRPLIQKVKLPREIFIISRVYTAFTNFGFSCIAYILMLIVFRIRISWTCVMFLGVCICMLFFSLGISLLMATIYPFYKDIRFIYSNFLILLDHLIAMFYPIDMLSGWIKKVVEYNPLYVLVKVARESVLYGKVSSIQDIEYMCITAIGVLIIGVFIFKINENRIILKM